MNLAAQKLPELQGQLLGATQTPAPAAEAEASDAHALVGPGGGDSQDLVAALGHYAEAPLLDLGEGSRAGAEAQYARQHPGDINGLSAFRISEAYEGPSANNVIHPLLGPLPVEPEHAEIGAIDTADHRLAALSAMTQESQNGDGTNECGAATLVGGALLAGGKNGEGLIALMNGMEHEAGSDAERQRLAVWDAQVREKLKNGEALTVGDMHDIQANLHKVMHDQMEDHSEDKKTGVNVDTMNRFLADNSDLQKLFKKNHLGVSHIDNDGEDGANHFVLSMEDAEHHGIGVYDPSARKNGQVVTDAAELRDYRNAQSRWVDGSSS